MRLNNLNVLKSRRRKLRSELTPAEARLWLQLQNRKLNGLKFRRQHGVGPFVLDFYCAEEKLAIELDGAAHDHEAAVAGDEARSRYLQALGIRVVRFENREVLDNLEGVLVEIARHTPHGCTTPALLAPPLLVEEGRTAADIAPCGNISPRAAFGRPAEVAHQRQPNRVK